MIRPLYNHSSDVTPTRSADGNAGLWYDKFCDQWHPCPVWSLKAEEKKQQGTAPKHSWIRTLTGHPIGVRDDLEETTTRLIRLSEAQGGLSLVFHSESRFVTGLGRSHPLENGFAWHQTLGTPFLPGSSIKGLLLAWTRTLDDPTPDPATVQRIFGAAGQAGSLSFLDAVPIAPVSVEGDVLTPHYAGWSPTDPPGDWRSPKPVPFLVTAKGLRLLFTIVPRAQPRAGDLKLVESWLIDALAWAGAGAKTAVGYGRMALDRSKTDELLQAERQKQRQRENARIEAERLANLDPLDRELEKLAAVDPAQQQPQPRYRHWIKAVESGRWGDQTAVIRLVLDRIVAEMRQAGHWRESSSKKNPGKDKPFQDTTRVKELLRRHA